MAKLTLQWPVGRYRIETQVPPKGRIRTVFDDLGPTEWVVLEGPKQPPRYAVDEVGANGAKGAALYERIAKIKSGAAALAFVSTFGFLWSTRGREGVEDILAGAAELRKLLAAKERDDWQAAAKWLAERPRAAELTAAVGIDDTGRHQLVFRPRHLFGLSVAKLIQDWSNGAAYKFCRRPGCGNYFYYGPGTGKRETAQYCGPTCQNAHAYTLRKEHAK
jgi:hypothetical protein